MLEIVEVLFIAPSGEWGHLEVVVENAGEAVVERGTLVGRHEAERVVYRYMVTGFTEPVADGGPQINDGEDALEVGESESVEDALVA